ncbi:hypothetical protein TRVL_09619 [Trypanosoma vivax]|nr:hypothetical protein TRVL_09619 [Trypanosoma vivax]
MCTRAESEPFEQELALRVTVMYRREWPELFFCIRNVLLQLPTLLSAALNNIVPRTGKTKLHMDRNSKCSKSIGQVRSESEFLRSMLTLDLCERVRLRFGCSGITRLRCGEHEVNYKNAQAKICKRPSQQQSVGP